MSTFRKFDWNAARSDFSTLFTDFHTYLTADWVITTTEAGAGSATEVLGAGGKLVITNDAADNDLDAFQWAGGTGAVAETFKFTVGKKLQFVTRFKLLEVLQADLMIGLYITDTDPVGGVSDGIYFRKVDGSAVLSLVAEKNATESTVAVATLVADTEITAEFYYDGSNAKIMAYIDGVLAGSVPLTNAPDDEEIALSFVVQNGEAVANVLTLDFIGATQQR